MAVKDITEKILLSYTDVFADVVNGLLFKGQQISRCFIWNVEPALPTFRLIST